MNFEGLSLSEIKQVLSEMSPYEFEKLCLVLNAPKIMDCEAIPDMFQAHEGQVKAWKAERKIVAVFKGWQAGGTLIGAPWLRREIQRKGAGDYFVISPTSKMMDNKMLPELKGQLGFEGLFNHNKVESIMYLNEEGEMRLFGELQTTPTRILLRTATHPDDIESFTANGGWVDEAGTMDGSLWDKLQARLSIHDGRLLITSRPYRHNWFVTDVWEKRFSDPHLDVINFSSLSNPAFRKEDYERALERKPKWWIDMYYNGIPTRPAGAIYDCIAIAPTETQGVPPPEWPYNTCSPFEIPRDWLCWIGVDFGGTNTAVVMLAVEQEREWGDLKRTGRAFVFATYWPAKQMTSREHYLEVKKKIDLMMPGAKMPLGWGGSHGESGWREAWALAGLPIVEPPINSKEVQIQRVYTALKTRKLIIMSHLDKFLDELTDYSRAVDEDGNVTEAIDNDAKYHRVNALQYVGSALFPELKGMQHAV